MSDTTANELCAPAAQNSRRPYLTALPGSWPWAVAFMLSLSALGLHFSPAFLVVVLSLVNRFNRNRYDFIIQITLLFGGFAITDSESLGLPTTYIVFLASLICAVLLRKTPVLKKAVWSWLAYTAALFVFAFISEETLPIQMGMLIGYCVFGYFAVPIASFAGKEFRFNDFCRALLPYAIILSIYYILDAFVLSGWVLVPRSHSWFEDFSAYYHLVWSPFSGFVVRKSPPGLYLLTLLLLPVVRMYRLRLWQWAIVLLALMSTQTFTFISGFLIFFFMFQKGVRRKLLVLGLGIAGVLGLYFVDASMAGKSDDFITVSPMRIYSSVNQFTQLNEAMDVDDMADFGSGRIGQAIPKLELLYNLGYQWKGLGFLNRFETSNPKFIIENEYYLDQSESIEVATNIEITALQALVNIGYIGLALHILFFIYTYWIVRKLPHRLYYLSVMLLFVWFGMAGFEGLIYPKGLIMVGLAFAVTYLSNKNAPDRNAG